MNRIDARSLTGLLTLAGLLSACASLPPLHPFGDGGYGTIERSVTFLAGVRNYEAESDFGSTDEQAVGGIELTWNRPDEPLAFELTLQHSYDSDDLAPTGEIESRVTDLQLGLRYRFSKAGIFRPYAGAGVALLDAHTRSRGFGFPRSEQDDMDSGLYVHAGMWAPFADNLRVGFDLRWLTEEWAGEGDFDLDSTQIAITVGAGF